MRHKLDLHANAMDSLNEGLRRYFEGRTGKYRAYKFAVLHFSHFVELLLKYGVSEEHPALIYRNPSKEDLFEASTIGLFEAVNILRNCEHDIDPSMIKDLRWLKNLRNRIEHHEFDLDIAEVRDALGRIIRASDSLADSMGLTPLEEKVEEDCKGVYLELLDDFEARLANAKADARRESKGEEADTCHFCWEDGIVSERDGQYFCHLCGDTDEVISCGICGTYERKSLCHVWNNDDPKETTYACEPCLERMILS